MTKIIGTLAEDCYIAVLKQNCSINGTPEKIVYKNGSAILHRKIKIVSIFYKNGIEDKT